MKTYTFNQSCVTIAEDIIIVSPYNEESIEALLINGEIHIEFERDNYTFPFTFESLQTIVTMAEIFYDLEDISLVREFLVDLNTK